MSKSVEILTIEVEAISIEEVQKKLKEMTPTGWNVISEEVISEPDHVTVSEISETSEDAFAACEQKIAEGAVVTNKKICTEFSSKFIVLQAYDKDSVRKYAANQIGKNAVIDRVRIKEKGAKGFLGIGKRPNSYEIKIDQKAVVEMTASIGKVKIRAVLRDGIKPEFLSIPVELSKEKFIEWLNLHNIPQEIENMEIFKCSNKPEFFRKHWIGKPFYEDGNNNKWLINEALVKRLRLSFDLSPTREFNLSGFTYSYGGSSVADYATGCKDYQLKLRDADKIVHYVDMPCVVMHIRTQENKFWDHYYACFRDSSSTCVIREIAFKCDSQEVTRREQAEMLKKIEKEDLQLAEGPVAVFRDPKSTQSVCEKAMGIILSDKDKCATWLLEIFEETDNFIKWSFVCLLTRERSKAFTNIRRAIDGPEQAHCLQDLKSILDFAEECEVEEPTLMEYQKDVINSTAGLEGYAVCYRDEDNAKAAFRVFAALCFAAKNIEKEPHKYAVVLAKTNASFPYILVVLTNAPKAGEYYASIVCGNTLVPIYNYLKGEDLETMSVSKAQGFFQRDVDHALGYVIL